MEACANSAKLYTEWTTNRPDFVVQSPNNPSVFRLKIKIAGVAKSIFIQMEFKTGRFEIFPSPKTDDIYVQPGPASFEVISQLRKLGSQGKGPLKIFINQISAAENINSIPPKDIIELPCTAVK